jgi:glycine oxidase
VHVAVIGAGIMGCAAALALEAKGAKVTLLERAIPGAEASSAAAGILGAQVESLDHPEQRGLFVRARSGYAAWVRDLEAETGIATGYRVSGVLKVARTQDEVETLGSLVSAQRKEGLHAELLSPNAAREVEPELHPGVAGAAHFPDDAQVDPPALLRALVARLARSKVTLKGGALVKRLDVRGGVCRGVVVDEGMVEADATVLAAGSWSKTVPGVPDEVPDVRPARGQMVLLEERPPRVRSILFGTTGYVVPRGDGRVLCGSTLELVGFRKEVTAQGALSILRTAIDLAPGLGSAALSSTWSNFRPYTTAGAPLMGRSPLAGLFLATGHHRNGILLAKITADAVTDAVLG